MKKLTILGFLTLASIGCNSTAQQTANTNVSVSNRTNVSAQKPDSNAVISSHSSETAKSAPAPPTKNDSSQSPSGGSPMAKSVDVSKMTADIEAADKSYKQNQKDEKAKDNLAEAYFVRGFALTEAAQYRAALGDFRKGLKLNPSNTEAKQMHDQIIEIFQSMQREPPKEGEEPAPLPINK